MPKEVEGPETADTDQGPDDRVKFCPWDQSPLARERSRNQGRATSSRYVCAHGHHWQIQFLDES